jgi:acyl-CoA synthetase (AMP-forming)/AMP-acid ligase II
VSGGGLLALLDDRARTAGHDRGLRFVDTGAEWSYGTLARRAGGVAAALDPVAAGERVGLLADDRAVFSAAFFGIHARGATPVPLGIHGRPGTEAWATLLADRVARFGLSAVVADPATGAVLGATVGTARVVVVGGDAEAPLRGAGEGPIAFVQPSSGTTGDPKGVVVAHDAVLANLAQMGEHWELSSADVGLSWLPLFHDMGLIGTLLNAVYQGGVLYHWPTASFLRAPGRWLQLVDELGVTVAVGPPFALALVTRRQQRRGGAVDLARLRCLLVGAEQIRPEVLTDFVATFAACGLRRAAVCPTYGLAEATLAVSGSRHVDDVDVVATSGARTAVSCGPPLPGVEVRLGSGDELEVRSASVMDGYLDDETSTAATVVDGWLRTGDTAALVDGDVVVLGRTKEMINRGGIRLPATDFELALAGVDGLLADRIVVFADADADAERVVVLAESRWRERAGEAVLAARARLADAGLPVDHVELVPPGFIPRTTSGKLRRAAARDKWRAAVSGG